MQVDNLNTSACGALTLSHFTRPHLILGFVRDVGCCSWGVFPCSHMFLTTNRQILEITRSDLQERSRTEKVDSVGFLSACVARVASTLQWPSFQDLLGNIATRKGCM